MNISPNLSSIKVPKAEAKRVYMRKRVGIKEFSSGTHVFGEYEIEERGFCDFIVRDTYKVAEISARKCDSAVQPQQQRTRTLERHPRDSPPAARSGANFEPYARL